MFVLFTIVSSVPKPRFLAHTKNIINMQERKKRREELPRGETVDHRWQTKGPWSALHLVLSSPAPCFYPVAAPSSLPLVKE